MKHNTQKRQTKSSKTIYLAGPFFNDVQLSWAQHLAKTLRERGYKIYAPVDFIYQEGSEYSPRYIFNRNLLWMSDSDLILAQLDYPFPDNQELSICTKVNPSEFNGLSYKYKVIHLPDSGTIWEIGWAYCRGTQIIGYSAKPVTKVNLMLAQCLSGWIDNPLDVFTKDGILWKLVKPWTGEQL